MNTKHIEALKLALEALENSVDLVIEEARQAQELYGRYLTRQARVRGLQELAEAHQAAIAAAREALAEQPDLRFANPVGLTPDQKEIQRQQWQAEQPAQQEPSTAAYIYQNAYLNDQIQKHPVWVNVSDALPAHGQLVLCEFEDGVLDVQFPVNDGYMVERWDEGNPVAGVTRWIAIDKIPETADELRAFDGLKFSAAQQSVEQPAQPRCLSNCGTCDHKARPDGGWCYMFRNEPQGVCARHTPMPEQPAQQDPVAWITWSALTGEPRLGWTCESEIASEALFKAAPSQQQAPVTDEENEKFSRDVSNFNGADPEATKYALEEFLKSRAAPPASKPWVSLTDEEANEYNHLGPDMRWVIQEVEAKLKEKNT